MIKIIKAQHGAYGVNGKCGYVIDKPDKEPYEYSGLDYNDSGVFVKLENGYIWNIGTEIQFEILQKGDNGMNYDEITDVDIIVPNKVVEVTFAYGDKQKAV